MINREAFLTKPIPSLVWQIAFPAAIGMFFNTMFNVVNTYYAGMLSVDALAALSLSFPLFFLIIALSSGIQQGTQVLISNELGAHNVHEAREYAVHAFLLACGVSIILTILGFVSLPYLLSLFHAVPSIVAYSMQYLNIILLGAFCFVLLFTVNSFLTAQGNTTVFRNSLIAGFVLNCILDPLFMFGYSYNGITIIPKMDIAGLALATILIQAASLIYVIIVVYKTPLFDTFKINEFSFKWKYIWTIVKQGFPASINMMTVALGIFIITFYFGKFGSEAIAAYGIATRIEQIALLPLIGLNIAVMSIIGQNNGANKLARVKKTYWFVIKIGVGMMFIAGILLFFLSYYLMSLFTSDLSVINTGASYLQIAALLTWAYVILFVTTAAYQGIKKPTFVLWMGIFRQIAIPLVLFPFMAAWFGIHGIFWGIFIINAIAAIVALLFYGLELKKMNQ